MEPATVPNRPTAHAVQALAPVARLLYAPAEHAVHAAEVVVASSALYRPALQAVHPLVPVASPLYEPTAHWVQGAPPPAAA